MDVELLHFPSLQLWKSVENLTTLIWRCGLRLGYELVSGTCCKASVWQKELLITLPGAESLSNQGRGNGEKHIKRIVHHLILSSCHRKGGELKPAET